MRFNVAGGVIAALLVVALIVAYSTLFTVYRPVRRWSYASASRCAS
jgi:hypothetical protein